MDPLPISIFPLYPDFLLNISKFSVYSEYHYIYYHLLAKTSVLCRTCNKPHMMNLVILMPGQDSVVINREQDCAFSLLADQYFEVLIQNALIVKEYTAGRWDL